MFRLGVREIVAADYSLWCRKVVEGHGMDDVQLGREFDRIVSGNWSSRTSNVGISRFDAAEETRLTLGLGLCVTWTGG